MPEYQLHGLSHMVLQGLEQKHIPQVTGIYNDYVLAGTAAFPQKPVTGDFFDFLVEMPEIYPAFVLLDTNSSRVVGFCFLSPFHPQPTFRKTALVDYFITPGYTGRGLGSLCLRRLEQEAKKVGIAHIIADVSSENHGSIAFHEKHGFRRCGTLENIGNKLGRDFGVVHLQKDIEPECPAW